MNREVISVKQSPLNTLRWCLSLACGHAVWVTSKSKPVRKITDCERCSRPPQEAPRE